MTDLPALGFPGRRPLAAWWRQLARWQPRTLWVGHLLLHRVEALAVRSESARLDPIDRLVLKALALTPGETVARLDEPLHLGRQLLAQVLRGLQAAGLAEATSSAWSATARGQEAVQSGEYLRPAH